MYLLQKIDVNVTQENADILKRPSKIFNSIKAIFHGGMTPTEQRQSEVMLSILQRLNIALRQSEFNNLASVAVNDQTIYESVSTSSLENSNDALAKSFETGDITKVNTLALTVDAVKGGLNYLIHVSVVSKPKAGVSPISLQVYGFIDEFKRIDAESIDIFSDRVKQLMAKTWGNEKEREAKLAILELEFDQEVSNLQARIDSLFPSKSSTSPIQRTIKKDSFKSKNTFHNVRYDDTYIYLPYFYADLDEKNYDMTAFAVDNFESWDNDSVFVDTASTSSDSGWGGFDFSDSSSSSCGSSCGGGCGGS
ncbi:hypothetical protein [Glaciecola sp. MF2-115]|uniref:hypothetical protein n=1 Tax=Glaciecola sp. MF2-115 TaxID=3384827 RepID=UPI00399F2CB1